jgi:CDP-diacylglycerol---glycerol-3-phosphate 3-phosphatidyltransferase
LVKDAMRRVFSPTVTLPDQLTLGRALAVPVVVVLFAWDFTNHAYIATGVFVVAMATDQVDGWLARRWNQTSAFGSLLDPIADKVLVLAALVMLVAEGVAPAWMVAAIVAREFLVSGLRLAAIERGVVIGARDLGKLKTWAQAVAVGIGGFAAAGAWSKDIAWWALLVAVLLTWLSGLDYARVAPRILRDGRVEPAPVAGNLDDVQPTLAGRAHLD